MNIVQFPSGLRLSQLPADARRAKLRKASELLRLMARLRGEDPVDCLARIVMSEAKRLPGGRDVSR